METKEKQKIIKIIHDAMNDFIEENKNLYSPLEQQEQAMIVTMFVSGYLPTWFQNK